MDPIGNLTTRILRFDQELKHFVENPFQMSVLTRLAMGRTMGRRTRSSAA